MVFFLLAAASYAAYKKRVDNEEKNRFELDASINLDRKIPISLLQMERELGLFEFPVATVSFFDGDYREAARYLERRLDEILALNPWLAGWLVPDAADGYEIKLFYDPQGKDRCQGVFEVFDDPSVIKLSRATPYQDMAKLFVSTGAMVPNNRDLIGKNKPIFKVSLVPDADEPDNKYGLIVSLSHAGGDCHTYYDLVGMMDLKEAPRKLDPVRSTSYAESVEKVLGTREARYLQDAVTRPLLDLQRGKVDDPVGIKLIRLTEDWFTRRQEESGFDCSGDAATANALLSSWFFSLNDASIGLVVVNMRDRIEGFPVGRDSAGNYLQSLVLRRNDYETPELVRKGLTVLRRCGIDSEKDLPPFLWTMTSSLYGSWAYLLGGIQLEDSKPVVSHLPVWDLFALSDFPDRLSAWVTFSVDPTQGSERLGALVVCRNSVWTKIQESGLVASVIADSASLETS